MMLNLSKLIKSAIKYLGGDPFAKREDFSGPTPAKGGTHRHRGYTKRPHNPAKAKTKRRMADKSRRINRK